MHSANQSFYSLFLCSATVVWIFQNQDGRHCYDHTMSSLISYYLISVVCFLFLFCVSGLGRQCYDCGYMVDPWFPDGSGKPKPLPGASGIPFCGWVKPSFTRAFVQMFVAWSELTGFAICIQYVCIFGKSGTKFWQKVDWICGEFDAPQQQQLFAFVK